MSIGENYLEIVERKNRAAVRSGRNPEDVLLLAVTKLHTVEEINQAISAGATDAGENRVQELLEKYDRTAEPVRWHLIGHLQTNKVKNIIDKVVLIHSVDSLKLAKEISKRAIAADKVMDILIEINIGMEESKSGVPAEDVESLVKEIAAECEGVRIRGEDPGPPAGTILAGYSVHGHVRRFRSGGGRRRHNRTGGKLHLRKEKLSLILNGIDCMNVRKWRKCNGH